jgi:hypothetical protein
MLIGLEREGSSLSAGAPAVQAMPQERQQLPLQDSAAMSEAGSFVQGTFGSSMQDVEDSQQQQQQQQQGLSGGTSGTSWSVQLQLLHGDLTNPNLASPSSGFWQAHGLNPGVVDLAACIEVLEHLEPRAVDALGHSVLGGLCPKTAVFTTPNWEYNSILRAIHTGEASPRLMPALASKFSKLSWQLAYVWQPAADGSAIMTRHHMGCGLVSN